MHSARTIRTIRHPHPRHNPLAPMALISILCRHNDRTHRWTHTHARTHLGRLGRDDHKPLTLPTAVTGTAGGPGRSGKTPATSGGKTGRSSQRKGRLPPLSLFPPPIPAAPDAPGLGGTAGDAALARSGGGGGAAPAPAIPVVSQGVVVGSATSARLGTPTHTQLPLSIALAHSLYPCAIASDRVVARPTRLFGCCGRRRRVS